MEYKFNSLVYIQSINRLLTTTLIFLTVNYFFTRLLGVLYAILGITLIFLIPLALAYKNSRAVSVKLLSDTILFRIADYSREHRWTDLVEVRIDELNRIHMNFGQEGVLSISNNMEHDEQLIADIVFMCQKHKIKLIS